MGVRKLPGNPEIEVNIRRHARARRMILRLSRTDGSVHLTIPRGVSEREALAFAEEKRGWLEQHLSARAEDLRIAPGLVLPVGGTAVRLAQGAGRLRFEAGTLHLPADPDRAGAAVQAWLKAQARAALAATSDRYAARLGRGYTRLTLRDPRSRWGSCSSQGALMYSWRLILAPPDVLDYVAAHEVAHLREMNHSRAFWDIVERLYGDPRPARTWLREKGLDLHRYRFEA